ncbi:MAG: hypothetical protein AB7O47_11365 [Flavobacteriales bacterium]
MNAIKYFGIIVSILLITSCGGDDTKQEVENVPVELKGYEELDLSPWGFQMAIMVPNAEDNGEPQVVLTERGALEIVVGQTYGIEIMFGEGDIELLKMDLKDDLVFTSEIVKEEPNALIYKQDIPDSGIKTQNHFFYKAQVGTDVYEVRDLIDGSYGQGMIESMLNAAKTLREVKPKVAA